MDHVVQPSAGLVGHIESPPDKSIAHRAAMFASLADGKSIIENFSQAADPQSTVGCMKQLGVPILQDGTALFVTGVGRDGLKKPVKELNCGNSGTTLRLLSGILAGAGIEAILTGDASLRSRTMTRIINPLREFGASISGKDDGYAPIVIGRHSELRPFRYELPIASAQLKSCMLLAGLYGNKPMQVVESFISRNHTELLLDLPVEKEDGRTVISSSRSLSIPEQNFRIPGDFSSAFFWLVAGSIIPGSRIEIMNAGLNPTRTGGLEVLKRMGADISISKTDVRGKEPVGIIAVVNNALKACDISGDEIPLSIDEIPALSVAMAFAEGISHIRDASELRHKECDRIAALAALFRAAGIRFEEHPDGMTIYGNPNLDPIPGNYASSHDHRIAMSAAILALRCKKPCKILDGESSAISYPGFWNDLTMLSYRATTD